MIQPTHRAITIEDTREINLPKYLKWNWVPLTTRDANPEGKGEISMLDLIVTSLRMRPDRIIIGEIRRRREAEVLFEAMHTGHSVYSTIHADTAENLERRLLEPPIEIPSSEVEALHLMVIVYRDRKKGERRVFEIAEVLPGAAGKEFELNYLYRWNTRTRQFMKVNESRRIIDELGLHTGMTKDDILKDIAEKEEILQWMLDKNIQSLDGVGEVMDEYYKNPAKLLERVRGR
jgi:flagellar protein FlaI